MQITIPKDYDPVLSVRETQEAIKYIRDTFQKSWAESLVFRGFRRHCSSSTPLVSMMISMVRKSLFLLQCKKWERADRGRAFFSEVEADGFKKYGFHVNEGLYTNMNAIRKDEELDNLHSAYVDQWDWEKVIDVSQRNVQTLKNMWSRFSK